MIDMNNKSAIEKAKIEFDEIVGFAKDNLMKEMEEKVENMVKSAIDELEQVEEVSDTTEREVVSEAIKLETDEMTIKVSDEGAVSVTKKEPKEDELSTSDEVPTEVPEEDPIEIDSDEDPISIEDDITETELDNTQDQQMDQQQPTAAPAAPPVEAPAAETPAPTENPMDMLYQAISAMIDQKMGGADASAGTEGGDGVDIVDDDNATQPAAQPAPAAAPAPAPVDENNDEIIELELDEEEMVDEIKMHGVSNTVQRTAGRSAGPKVAVDNRGRGMNESLEKKLNEQKVQYEATIAGLTKENASLKGEIKGFKESFIELRGQFNEVQDFNAKLSLAYNAVKNNELTEEEKMEIVGKIEKAKNVNEAKKIYKDLVGEKANSTPRPLVKSIAEIGGSAIPTVKAKNAIYENSDVKRMKKLAGLLKNDPDSLID